MDANTNAQTTPNAPEMTIRLLQRGFAEKRGRQTGSNAVSQVIKTTAAHSTTYVVKVEDGPAQRQIVCTARQCPLRFHLQSTATQRNHQQMRVHLQPHIPLQYSSVSTSHLEVAALPLSSSFLCNSTTETNYCTTHVCLPAVGVPKPPSRVCFMCLMGESLVGVFFLYSTKTLQYKTNAPRTACLLPACPPNPFSRAWLPG